MRKNSNLPCCASFQFTPDTVGVLAAATSSLSFTPVKPTDSTSSCSPTSWISAVGIPTADSGRGRDRALAEFVTSSDKLRFPRLAVRRNVRRGPMRDCSEVGSMPITVEIRLSVVVRSHFTSSTTGTNCFGEEDISARCFKVMASLGYIREIRRVATAATTTVILDHTRCERNKKRPQEYENEGFHHADQSYETLQTHVLRPIQIRSWIRGAWSASHRIRL